MTKVDELKKRVRLTGEEIVDAKCKAIEDEPCSTPPERLTELMLWAVSEAATNKVLKDPDLALIDRGNNLPIISYRSAYPENEERYQEAMLEAGYKQVIPLAKALEEQT